MSGAFSSKVSQKERVWRRRRREYAQSTSPGFSPPKNGPALFFSANALVKVPLMNAPIAFQRLAALA